MTCIVDEAEMWSRARAGDGRAFAGVFDRHRDRCFRHALRLVASAAEAEDVVAAAFLEMWRRRDAVSVVDGSVLPWLLVTATNLARNSGRGVRRYRAAIDRLPRSAQLEDPAQLVQDRLEHARLAKAVNALGRVDAALLTLTALEGYSTSDAAAVLGISPGAARVRLHRARKRLQVHLAPEPAHRTSMREGTIR